MKRLVLVVLVVANITMVGCSKGVVDSNTKTSKVKVENKVNETKRAKPLVLKKTDVLAEYEDKKVTVEDVDKGYMVASLLNECKEKGYDLENLDPDVADTLFATRTFMTCYFTHTEFIKDQVKELGLELDKSEKAKALKEYKQRLKGTDTEEEFMRGMKDVGFTSETLNVDMARMVNIELVRAYYTKNTVVTEEEMHNYYNKNKADYEIPGKFIVSYIRYKNKEDAIKDNNLLKDNKTTFEELYKSRSRAFKRYKYNAFHDQEIDLSGNWFTAHSALNKLDKREVGLICFNNNQDWGYYLVKVKDRDARKYKAYKDVSSKIKKSIQEDKVYKVIVDKYKEWEVKKGVKYYYGIDKFDYYK